LEPHVGTSTCTEAGTCSLCGGTIPALGHDWATTLTNGGDTHYYACSRCTAKKDEAAHSGGTATCVSRAICDECGQGYGSPAPGHKWSSWMPMEDGSGHKRTCSACSTEETEDHVWDEWRSADPYNHFHTCEKCYADEEKGHEFVEGVCELCGRYCDHEGGKATCTEKAICAICKTPYGEVDADAHPEDKIVTDTAVEATCEKTGLTEGKHCSACGEVIVAQKEIAALGHEPGEEKITETDTEITKTVACKRCGKVLSTETTEKETSEDDPSQTEHDYYISKRTITRTYFTCRKCGDTYWIDNKSSRNLLDGLVRDEDGNFLDYTAGIIRPQGPRILKVVADISGLEADDAACLYLLREQAEEWISEGITAIEFHRGDISLMIPDLQMVLAENEGIAFEFVLRPAEDGAQVQIWAENAEEEKKEINAEELGIELK
ncbi:MAG: hypothetical protein IJT99_01120, partial [Clostridia bacterium]|nr:hypothetical protein [Clostridia bacterium]